MLFLSRSRHEAGMGSGLDMLAALCGPASFASGGGIVAALALAGMAGSAMHCVPMCGGFVLGQVADRVARLPGTHLCEWRRIGAGALLPYHLGRLSTYALLGAIAGATGGALARIPWLAGLSTLLLLAAACLFLLHALRRLAPHWDAGLAGLERAPAGWSRVITRITARIGRSPVSGGYSLGLALGLLPCGFLYAALMAAGASFSPLWGAVGMLAFGLGTAPALIAVGIAGQAAGRRWQRGIAAAAPAVMLLNAALLGALALRHLITVT